MRLQHVWASAIIGLLVASVAFMSANGKARSQPSATWPDMLIQVWDGEQWQFQRVSSDGTTTNLLVDAPEFLYIKFLAYSPDRQWLYFGGALEEDDPHSFEPISIEGLPRRVYRIPITGGKPEVIIDTAVEGSTVCGTDFTCYDSVRLTPDGQYFVYIPDKRRPDGWRGIWRIRSDGTENTEISAALDGSQVAPYSWYLSPDGEWVYFDLVGGDGSVETRTDTIYRARVTGNPQPEKITEISLYGVLYIGDGWLLSSLPDETPYYAISLTTDHQTVVVQEPKSSVYPYRVFSEQDIVILQSTPGDSQQITSFAVRLSDGTPLWEFAGEIQAVINDEWVILKKGRFDSATPLTRMRLDGTDRTELDGGRFPSVGVPRVAGDWIVVGNGDSQASSIRAVNWKTGEERLLWQTDIPDTFLAYLVAVSADGAWILAEVISDGPNHRFIRQWLMLSLDGHTTPSVAFADREEYDFREFSAWFPE